MLWLYRYLRGYLKIEIKGDYSEKALNLCAANRISLWNSAIIKNGIITCILIKDFSKFRNIMRGSKLRVHITEKNGFPIKLYKNRKRKGLLIGLVCLLAFLKIMSGFIWVIDVEGNTITQTEDILAACKEIGITEGIRNNRINPKIKREELLLKLDTLAWAALNVEGSRLTVNVTEIKKEDDNKNLPTNITDGIIKHIDVSSGSCTVKIGDTVAKGDILVSGVLEASDGTRFVRSIGSIIAETRRVVTVERDYKYKKEYETGVSKKRSAIDIFNIKIPLFIGNETKEYNGERKCRQLSLFGKSLPIRIYTKKYRYKKEENISLEREELQEMLKEDLKAELKKVGITEYQIVSENIEDTEKGLKLTAHVTATEDICVEEKLLITAEN